MRFYLYNAFKDLLSRNSYSRQFNFKFFIEDRWFGILPDKFSSVFGSGKRTVFGIPFIEITWLSNNLEGVVQMENREIS